MSTATDREPMSELDLLKRSEEITKLLFEIIAGGGMLEGDNQITPNQNRAIRLVSKYIHLMAEIREDYARMRAECFRLAHSNGELMGKLYGNDIPEQQAAE